MWEMQLGLWSTCRKRGTTTTSWWQNYALSLALSAINDFKRDQTTIPQPP